jgi:mono/diheme cytochrome c family protein
MRISPFATMAVLFVAPLLSATHKGNGDGKAVFKEQCAGCHGPDGRAQTDIGKGIQAADLTSQAVQQQSDSELSKSVKNGKGKMPAFQEKLSDGQIRAVVAYVRELGEKH